MPRIVPADFDEEFIRSRDRLVARGREAVAADRDSFMLVGRAIDAEFTFNAAKVSLLAVVEKLAKAVDGSLDMSYFPAFRRHSEIASVSPTQRATFTAVARLRDPNAGDNLRAARLALATKTLVGMNGPPGDLTRFLGAGQPNKVLAENARKAVLVSLAVLDQNATDYLGDFIDLGRAPQIGDPRSRPQVVGRIEVCREWGHDTRHLLREALGVLMQLGLLSVPSERVVAATPSGEIMVAPAESVAAALKQASAGPPKRIERPDFITTTDLRATSDPLWRNLAKFRNVLMEGGFYSPDRSLPLLFEIREAAHEAGLRPVLGKIEWIAATLDEARVGDPGEGWSGEPDGWVKMVLISAGKAGWYDCYELKDGFTHPDSGPSAHKRTMAIEWAESWMYAREAQLSGASEVAELKAQLASVAKTVAAAVGQRPKPKPEATWQAVQVLLLEKRERAEPFTTLRKLSKECKCSTATIEKAIDKSESLMGWKARSSEGRKSAPKASPLNEVVTGSAVNTSEVKPSALSPNDREADRLLAHLMMQARTPDQVAEIQNMSPEQRSKLAEAYQESGYDYEPSSCEDDKAGGRRHRVKNKKRA